MTTIFKYPLRIADRQTVLMPARAEVLAVMVQQGQTCVWAAVDPREALVERVFYICGTGNPLPDVSGLYHHGSVIDGAFVWHVYEGRERSAVDA